MSKRGRESLPPTSATSYTFDPSKPKSERGKEDAERMKKPTSMVDAAAATSHLPIFIRSPTAVILCTLLCVIFAFAIHIIQAGNLLVTLHPHHYEDCRAIPGPVGAEDVAIDSHGVTFVSSDARTWLPKMSIDGITKAGEAQKRMANLTKEEQGAIWVWDSRTPLSQRPLTQDEIDARLLRLKVQGMPDSIPDFHPHGIAIAHAPADMPKSKVRTWLYVINHARQGDVIVIVEAVYDSPNAFPPTLHYRGDIFDLKHLKSTNDLEAMYPVTVAGTPGIGGEKFLHTVWVSNFLGTAYGDTIGNQIESFTQAAWGSVALCQKHITIKDGKVVEDSTDLNARTICTMAIPAMSGPNGIQLSRDGRQLFVARSFKMDVHVYDLPTELTYDYVHWTHNDQPLLPLHFNTSIPMYSTVDNFHLDEESGDIFIGSHPKPLQIAAHIEDTRKRAPTQVLRIRKKGVIGSSDNHRPRRGFLSSHPQYDVEEVHLSLGEVFSGSSAGAWSRRGQQLVIGGVAEEGIYVCPYPAKDQQP